MIIKQRDFPTYLLQMEALARRLSPHHKDKEYIEKLARNARVGYRGEKSVDFNLSLLSKKDFHILHDLQLQDSQGFFQIDTLLIAPEFAIILEIKNIYGTITFDNMGQSIRTSDDGNEEAFPNPIDQVELQRIRLESKFQTYELPKLPIITLVIYSDSRTILKNQSNNSSVNDKVIHRHNLNSKIEQLSNQFKIKKLTNDQLKKLSNYLKNEHIRYQSDILEKYNIDLNSLITGVFCSKCSQVVMRRIYGTWLCPKCKLKNKSAHIEALQSYYLLINDIINNREAREFLQIKSIHVTKRLLANCPTVKMGKTSSRKHKLTPLMLPLIQDYK